MAIAPYFQRTAMAASQILNSYDFDGLVKLLNRHRIGLQIDSTAAKSAEGQASADLTVRLLARFYPKLAIVAADNGAAAEVAKLKQLALAINPEISVTSTLDGVSHCLVVGKSPAKLAKSGAKTIYMGSSNWIAKFSLIKPVGSGASKNPFAAGTAACLAVANLFRVVFAKQLPKGTELDTEVSFSLAALAKSGKKNNPAYKSVDIGRAHLVGAGAIGNGALWAFERSGMKGELNVVDHQRLDLSNMQRYVMAVLDDVEKLKTTLAVKWLSAAKGMKVVPHTKKWDELAHTTDWNFERVLVALDTAEDRIGVQASLPKWVANAYTLGSGIGVTRHHFLGQSACLACVYLPDGSVPSEDVLVAASLGLQTTPPHPEIMEVRRRLDRSEPCDRAFLELVAARKNLPLERFLPFEGRPLRELYQQGVCGGQVLGLQVDGRETRAEVPMAFQSAMAGILLAAELVLEVSGQRGAAFPVVTRFDLHRQVPAFPSAYRLKDHQGRCLCQDPDFVDRYCAKYGVQVAAPAATPQAEAQVLAAA